MFKIFLNMFIDFKEKEGGGEREKERDVKQKEQLVVSHTHSDWGSNLQPRCVP